MQLLYQRFISTNALIRAAASLPPYRKRVATLPRKSYQHSKTDISISQGSVATGHASDGNRNVGGLY